MENTCSNFQNNGSSNVQTFLNRSSKCLNSKGKKETDKNSHTHQSKSENAIIKTPLSGVEDALYQCRSENNCEYSSDIHEKIGKQSSACLIQNFSDINFEKLRAYVPNPKALESSLNGKMIDCGARMRKPSSSGHTGIKFKTEEVNLNSQYTNGTESLLKQEVAQENKQNNEALNKTLLKPNSISATVDIELLSVDVTDYMDPSLWDLKYASRIVNYVVKYCFEKYSIYVRWHPEDYDSCPGIEVAFKRKGSLHSIIEECEGYFYHKYLAMLNIYAYVTQSMFDAAVSVIYKEHLWQYYTNFLCLRLAVGIALLAVYSTQKGFSDAPYHAVHKIVSITKSLKENNYTNPCSDLVTIYRGSSLITHDMICHSKIKLWNTQIYF